MGFHAPSSEDVYRYIFRLDRPSQKGLSDGFSWSILFLNDSSPVCREFLAQYGTELCHRTADRVRFVFFSDLPKADYEHFASIGSQQGNILGGLIRAIVQRITRPWEYNFQRDEWERFKPDAFDPLSNYESIRKHISWETQLHTVMPGSGEALRLAQSLGIGRFVPCFLMFSDIGSPIACILPVGDKSPHEIFVRLRTWIDSYYEINHHTLRRWADIEDAILNVVQTSLHRVERWRSERENSWRTLQQITVLMNSSPNIPLLRNLYTDSSTPRLVKDVIELFLTRSEEIERKVEQLQDLRGWLAELSGYSDPDSVNRKLVQFQSQHWRLLPAEVLDYLKATLRESSSTPSMVSPRSQVYSWLRSPVSRPPSKNEFDRYHQGWGQFSKRKHGDNAIGRVGKILREEFETVKSAALAQPVGATPEEAARRTIAVLAAHLDVTEQDLEWESCIANYQGALADYFTTLYKTAPAWMLTLGPALSPALIWNECVWSSAQSNAPRTGDALIEFPRLKDLVDSPAELLDAKARELEIQKAGRHAHHLAQFKSALNRWIDISLHLFSADSYTVWLAMLTALAKPREEIEKQVFEFSKRSSLLYPWAGAPRESAVALLQLLDNYDQIRQSIELPFTHDPEVLTVRLDAAIAHSGGLGAELRTSSAERLKRELLDSLTREDRATSSWPDVANEALTWSPGGMLLRELKSILTPNRLDQVLSLQSNDPLSGLASRKSIVSVLDALSVHELIAVEQRVAVAAGSHDRATATTKQRMYASILLSIGLQPYDKERLNVDPEDIQPGAIERLKIKVRSGAFDVFLAHNSRDKDQVLRLSQELRLRGIHPWVDVEQIPPGRWFQDIIQSAVRTVKAAAIIIGTSGVGRWQALEMSAFVSRCIEQGIPLIPILLPGVAEIPNDLAFLRELNQVKFNFDVKEAANISRIVWGVTGENPLNS
jgi:hypothetical protein